MHLSSRSLLSTALFVLVSPLAVAAGTQPNGGTSINYRALQIQATQQAIRGAQASEYFANPYRAYPPSCLNAPIPFQLYQNDPNKVSTTITLTGAPLAGNDTEKNYTENDTVTVFRVPCGANASALLLEIDRPANASTQYYPVFPGVTIGSAGFVPRVASDPNTFFSYVYAFDPLLESTVVVFENAVGAATLIDYDQAITVGIDNLSGAPATAFNVPAYNASAYAANAQPLPISGYQSGNFYDPTHSGEGIQVEVGEIGTASSTRSITIAWYTFDDTGTPYWLFGQAAFTTGATSVSVPLYYGANGGFAGNFGSSATFEQWGTISVNFPDCNTMKFTYASAAGLPAGVPTGSNTNPGKTWTRLTQLNGLTCQ